MTADPRGLEIRYADDSGRRYAEDAVSQVSSQFPEGLPGLRISDHPDFAVRGYMLDISRDRVPTRATLARIVEVLGLARFNHLQLYTEHTFAYRDHEVVWRDSSPITPDDITWLDELCRSEGIELVANQNSFGHMERWLEHEPYRDRAECPEGFELFGRRREPTTLAPTPGNAEFSLGLLRELLANFTSRCVNIGCDETFELGKGRSAEVVGERGRARVFADHLRRLVEPLAADGYQVLFWADMLRKHPEHVRDLPAGVRPIAWTYEAPSGEGSGPDIPEAVASVLEDAGIDLSAHQGFATNVAPLAEAGIGFWVAPGTSSWNSLVGRWDNALANIADAADAGRANGCEGILLTDWGDNGHIQPPSVSFGPMLYAGAVAWCADANRDVDVPSVLDTRVFSDEAGVLGGVLERAGRLWGRTGRRTANASPLFAALFPHQFHFTTGDPDPARLGQLLEDVEWALGEMDRARPRCEDAEIVVAELSCALRLARHGAWRLSAEAGRPVKQPADLAADLREAIEEQRGCWMARARPGGLGDSMAHLEKTLGSYR